MKPKHKKEAAVRNVRKRYFGWSNKQTWLIDLWIGSNKELSEHWNREAKICRSSLRSDEEETISLLEAHLKEQVSSEAPKLEGPWDQLMDIVLSEVNWREIARAIIKNVEVE